MKIPCRISHSRHGIYYFRLQFTQDGLRKESRISLQTKNPLIAREKSLLISAMMVGEKMGVSVIDKNPQNLLAQIQDKVRKLEVVYSTPNGASVAMKADPNNPNDIEALLRASKEFWDSDLGQSMKRQIQERAADPSTRPDILKPAPKAGGATIPELIERFATRQGDKLAPKTLYEYRNYQKIFKNWVAKRKQTEHYPIREINRQDVSDFIDDLLAEGITHNTVQQKYLRGISALFELAQITGSYPEGVMLPSRGHKLFTKKDAKKTKDKRGWKPFTDDELAKIFNPEKYLAQKNPTDYWLPLLGLFTGGRIAELCQLLIQDIHQIQGIWAISITDEDESQRLKTPAAKRTIPIHSRLIELGFLDFVADMKPFGGMLFPYLSPNAFGNFSETPSERFGKYLDSLEITDKSRVFHSFRSTSNNHLKQKGVTEETRCQFIGHEHDTTNSRDYSEAHSVEYLSLNVASKLDFNLPFENLLYPRKFIVKTTLHKLKVKERRLNHIKAKTN
jgi:integrase